MSLQRFIPVDEFMKQNPGMFKPGTIKFWRQTDFRGFRAICYPIGKRLFFNLEKLEKWMDGVRAGRR